MNSLPHTVIIPGGQSIGPLPLGELREQLRLHPVPDDATVVIHSRLGDQFTLVGRVPELASFTRSPENSIECPYCDTRQPTCVPGEHRCVRCGCKLLISEAYTATLLSDPKRFWNLCIPGIIGIAVFAKLYPSDIGFAASLTYGFGIPTFLMLRYGVGYTRYEKFTFRQSPIRYGIALCIAGLFTLVGLGLLIAALVEKL